VSQVSQDKFVAVLADDLPIGVAVNAGALLGVSMGRLFPQVVGPEVVDASGTTHPGISAHPLPVLKVPQDQLRELTAKARATPQITVVDFTEEARRSRTYAEYTERLGEVPTREQQVIGAVLHGPKTAVTSLTGDLPLYR
jgi:hypothetical protein